MLQAEILVQYGMRNKAVERLQRIQELFPREEERNEDLQRLYLAAGVTPRYAGSAPLPPAAVAAPVRSCAGAGRSSGTGSGGRCSEFHARGGDYAQTVSPGHGAGGAEHSGERDWRRTGKRRAALRPWAKPAVADARWMNSARRESRRRGPRLMAELVACLQQAVDGHEPLAIQDAPKASALQSAQESCHGDGMRRRFWRFR